MAQGNFGTPSGAEEQVYITTESTYKGFVQPTGADAVRIIKSSFTTEQPREDRKDKRNTRSVSDRITRKKSGSFNLNMYALPSGTRGTPPDISSLLTSIFGTYTNTPATSDVYTLARDISSSFNIHHITGSAWGESLFGAVVNKATFRFKGEEEVEVEIEGVAADWVKTAPTTLSASAAAGASTITLTADAVGANSNIKIGTDDNTGLGYQVTAYDEATNIATISPVLGTDQAVDAAVVPYFADAVTTGQPLGCFPGTLTVGGTGYYVTEFEITIDNKRQLRNNEFGLESARGWTGAGFREVKFSGNMYQSTETSLLAIASENFGSVAVVMTAGTTAGRIMTVTMPTAELDILALDIPEEEEATFAISGTALAPVTAESEIVLSFT